MENSAFLILINIIFYLLFHLIDRERKVFDLRGLKNGKSFKMNKNISK